MANAQLMQEELQQSVILSEEDAEFEEDVPDDTMMADSSAPHPPVGTLPRDIPGEQMVDTGDQGDDDDDGEVDIVAEENFGPQTNQQGELEEMPADDDDEDDEADGDEESLSNVDPDVHDDDNDEPFDVDAEGEDDDEGVTQIDQSLALNADEEAVEDAEGEGEGEGEDDEDEDEDEGVGAVKIKPGETDDEEESESDAEISSASGSSDADDSPAEWEEDAENEDEDEEDSEAADPNNCIFCKKDEENDPAEEFEAYLACKGCGEHAHQQCARDAQALDDRNSASTWKCPECAADDADSESEAVLARQDVDGDGDLDMNGDIEDGDLSPTSTRRGSAPKIARDLLPTQRGVKTDSHSVFNQLVLDEDPMDGSRILRKRKTSSAEPEEEVMSLRKRRKNTSGESGQDEAAQEKANSVTEEMPVRPRSARSLRLKVATPAAPCNIVKKSRSSLQVKMRVDAAELRQLISKKPKPQKKRGSRAAASRGSRASRTTVARRAAAAAAAEPPSMPPFFSSSYSQPFYSFYDKETDELKGKPYGGILTEEQADTTKTLPTKDDRRRFDEAKQKADEEWRNRLLAMQAEAEVPVKKSKKAAGPASQIECIEFGGWEIDTWYAAPYPEEYSRNRVLYICEFCLKYMNSDYVAWRHKLKCPAKHPPGDEIYRHGSISFFEVDGRKNPVYCQNLCLLAKLFLGSKTLYYDVEPFLFYVLCEYDDLGYHFVGYFSKEKRASSQNNVSCILTLPIHQRKGYGHLLIDFSYLLTRVEEKTGSPEKPLSDMGLVSYRNYWRLVLCKYLIDCLPEDKSQKKGLSIRQISDETGMTPDDAISALEALRFLVRDPATHVYAFRIDLAYCHKEVAKWEAKNYVKLNSKVLTWTPYVMGRSNATNFELGPALNTIAPREEDEDNKAVQVLTDSGIATGDFAVTKDIHQKPPLEAAPAVLESTEPNDNVVVETAEVAKINGVGKENGTDPEDMHQDAPALAEGSANVVDEDIWVRAYEGIPVNRFQVYPPINTRRPAMGRLNSSITRTAAVLHDPSSVTRRRPGPKPKKPGPKPRRSTSTLKRKPAAKKVASTVKRKSGGTGRGPGRWPKGTKKSDYGNADSGPGLPPSWADKPITSASLPGSKGGDDDNETQDTVQVQVKEGKAQKGKGKQTAMVSARFEVKGDVAQASGSGVSLTNAGEMDIIMGEDEDADAEADEE